MMRRFGLFLVASVFFSEATVAGVPVDSGRPTDVVSDDAKPVPSLLTLQTLNSVAPPNGFLETEARLKATIALSEATSEGDLALARFYAANGLEAEALNLCKRLDASSLACADAVLIAKLNFSLGRFHAVISEDAGAKCGAVNERDQLASYTAAALSKLGAYRKALEALSAASPLYKQGIEEDVAAAILEALIIANEESATPLRNEIDRLHRSAERQLLSMLLALRDADLRTARSHASALQEANVTAEAQIRAQVMLARLDFEEGRDTAANINERMRRLSLKWQGGVAERELRNLQIEAAAEAGDATAALAAVRQLIAHAPQSDVAERAAQNAGALLPKLFEAAESAHIALTPAKAAAAFFDHVEFAPPGKEGDELIRSVVQNLAEIGLYDEAQKLLAHQVFNRLRGTERAMQAVTLAALYLENGKAADALLTLRRTRIEGLAASVNAERLRLEVEAMTRLGDTDAALAALERDEALTGAAALRAEILWRTKDWPSASKAYVDAARSAAGPDYDQYILRAATAAVLAGDDKSFQQIQKEFAQKLSDTGLRKLVEALGGDISSPEFLQAYKTAFGEGANGI